MGRQDAYERDWILEFQTIGGVRDRVQQALMSTVWRYTWGVLFYEPVFLTVSLMPHRFLMQFRETFYERLQIIAASAMTQSENEAIQGRFVGRVILQRNP